MYKSGHDSEKHELASRGATSTNKSYADTLQQESKPVGTATIGSKTNIQSKEKIATDPKINHPFKNKVSPNDTSSGKTHSTKNCYMIHDSFHDGFDQSQFSNRFNISGRKIPLLKNIVKETNNITRKIAETRSHTVFIHSGFHDLWSGDNVDDVINNYKRLVYDLPEKTSAIICISLIIPGSKYYPKLESEVNSINTWIFSFISNLRSHNKYQNRIYTANNNRLKDFMSRSVGPNGIAMVLNERGKKLLWLKLKDALERTTSIKAPSIGRVPKERQTYRRNSYRSESNRTPRNSRNHEY